MNVMKNLVRKGMSSLVLWAFFSICLVVFFPVAKTSKIRITRIATIDLMHLINLIKEDKILQKALSFENEKRLKEISKLQTELKEKQKALSEEKKDSRKYNELLQEIFLTKNQLDDFWSEASSFIMSNRRNFSENIVRSLYRIIKQEAQEQGYSLVIERSNSVIYADEDFDLTNAIEKRLKQFTDK